MEKINTLNGYIEECDRFRLGRVPEPDKRHFIEKVVSIYLKEIPEITHGLGNFEQRVSSDGTSVFIYDNDGDLEKLKGKLINHRENLEMQSQNQAQSSQMPAINVIQNNANNAIANASVTINFFSVVNAINSLDESVLSSSEKDDLTTQLSELEKVKHDNEKAWEKARGILLWFADKSVDVAIACLPYITMILSAA